MAANVETMFYVREKPWHGLGTNVEEAPTSKEALIAAGLNWNVRSEDIHLRNGEIVEGHMPNIQRAAISVRRHTVQYARDCGRQKAFCWSRIMNSDWKYRRR